MISLLLTMLGCNTVGFDAVSIAPIYGFVDGCGPITVSGHGFTDDVTARIGDNDITDIVPAPENTENPVANEHGFMFSGTVPASSLGVGYQDVTVFVGDKSDTITGSGAYYYVACPQTGLVTEVTVSSADGTVSPGATIEVVGCNLTDEVFAQVYDDTDTAVGGPIPLTHDCGTGRASFGAPAVPADGRYWLKLTNGDGSIVWSGLAGDYCGASEDAASDTGATSSSSSSSSSTSGTSDTSTSTTATTGDTSATTATTGDTSGTTTVADTGGPTPGVDTSVARDTAYGGGAYGCYKLTYGGAQ